jgi:hypothetical protein
VYDPAAGNFLLSIPAKENKVFNFGATGLVPLAGDWDGDGNETIGVYDL